MLSISDCSETYCFEFFVKWGSSCRFPAFGIENYFIETTIGFDGPIDYILASTIQPSPSAAYLLFLNDKATSRTVLDIMVGGRAGLDTLYILLLNLTFLYISKVYR